ncbi:hypothetical protein AAFF_G00219530 [Aldrovandia affinis]|uniref:Cadherin domain-containing protein n=1 Tax=Aldrovandia affinis TaxID=143900 RepID=A0AAD7RFY0_9TELE|nr:hypothetical protein AAFF_G00219530 [Aldrovandia affinis]
MAGVRICLLLLFMLVVLTEDVDAKRHRTNLIRKKRELEQTTTRGRVKVRYFLSGPGADQPPMNLFVVNEANGYVKINGILDREQKEVYNFTARVSFVGNGSKAEESIELSIHVDDQNDNDPVFKSGLRPGSVYEASPKGTFVTQVHAEDADKLGTPHTDLRYALVKQEPNQGMFDIEPETGKIIVKQPTLDREKQSLYVLTVQAKDMAGAVNGRTGTGTVKIKILDINDNQPSLDKDKYTCEIEENTANVEVMRFKTSDIDEENTDNWLAEFDIVSGNEDGYFSIKTDPKTNEGILMLNKAEEEVEQVEREEEVEEEEEVVEEVEVEVEVGEEEEEEEEGVEEEEEVVEEVEEVVEAWLDITLPVVLGNYLAIDEDTGELAQDVSYAKDYDPGSWLTVNEKTSEITLTRLPDRESKHVVDGVYYARILCLSNDLPAKTATGTIALQIEDSNDSCPELISAHQTACTRDTVVYVTAQDLDGHPYGPPFTFTLLLEGTTGLWDMAVLNDTTVALTPQGTLSAREYTVAFKIKDQQGLACPEPKVLTVEACECAGNQTCGGAERGVMALPLKTERPKFSAPAIGVLLSVFLVLLLVPLLLLFCSCGSGGIAGTFTDMPACAKEHLISYHTEGQGEDKEVPLLSASRMLSNPGPAIVAKNVLHAMASPMRDDLYEGDLYGVDGALQSESYVQEYAAEFQSEDNTYGGIALPDQYLEAYYSQKASCAAEGHPLKDSLLVYDYEGQGSAAGSVGCSSELEDDNDLDFLNDLDAKFKTLADICQPQKAEPVVTFALPPKPADATFDHEPEVVTRSSVDMVQSAPPTLVEKIDVNSTAVSAAGPRMFVRENVMLQNQAYVIQQPMFYRAAPVLATQYMIQPQVQKTVLVSDRPPVPSMQGVYVVRNAPAVENVVVEERRALASPAVHGGVIGYPQGSLGRGCHVGGEERGPGPGHARGRA